MTDFVDSRTEVPPIHNCGYIHKKNEPCPSHSVGPLKTWNKKQIDAALLSITNLTEQVERLQAENERLSSGLNDLIKSCQAIIENAHEDAPLDDRDDIMPYLKNRLFVARKALKEQNESHQ